MYAEAPVREVLTAALTRAAQTLVERSHGTGSLLREKDLQLALYGELVSSISSGTVERDAIVKPQQNVELGAQWPNVGPVDIAFHSLNQTTLIELKWGKSTLHNCVWDLAKLGCALGQGLADNAFLIAGTPSNMWFDRGGGEFFTTGSWSAAYLREKFLTWWRFWEKDVPTTRPFELPSTISTRLTGSLPLKIASEEWEVRCAQVVLDGQWSWTQWHSTLAEDASDAFGSAATTIGERLPPPDATANG